MSASRVLLGCNAASHGKDTIGCVVIVHGQADLLQIVDALGPPSGFACRLNGREQQRNQDRDDGDDYQKLDQGKTASSGLPHERVPYERRNRKVPTESRTRSSTTELHRLAGGNS